MRYKICFEDAVPLIINNVDKIEVKEGVYFFYDKNGVLLYAVKIKDVEALVAIDVIDLDKVEVNK